MAETKNPGFFRHYRRERLELQCRVLTPLFLGNAHQEAEWRAAPFKALLRYWWRVAQVDCDNHEELLKQEGKLFGIAGEGEEKGKSSKSLIEITVISNAPASKNDLGVHLPRILHPELDKPPDKKILPLSYLAGMGLMKPQGTVTRSYFPANSDFTLCLDFPGVLREELRPVLALIAAFGALGGRCRNGWGSIQIEGGLPWTTEELALDRCSQTWHTGFDQDYPHCLGRDNNRPLLWKTSPHNSWEQAMRELAEAYIALRAGSKTISKMDPGKLIDHKKKIVNFAERHLLGVPLTNHKLANIDRHASPLRFVVRRTPGGEFVGWVLHLPFRFAGAPPPFDDKKEQIKVWQKVHAGLDHLLTRAGSYGECL
jgi:CRISPR-associated protein Cmr1